MIKVNQTASVSGRYFSLEAIKTDGSVRQLSGGFPNLVTDVGLSAFAHGGGNLFTRCMVGTGNQTPDFTDTSLQNQIASSDSSSVSRGNNLAEGFAWCRLTFTFSQGAVVGNVSELGIGSDSVLYSRALILDQYGNPTTITLLSDEQLRVTWEHRFYWPTEDVSGELENEGNKGGVFPWTARAARVGDWTCGITHGRLSNGPNAGMLARAAPSALGDISGQPSGATVAGSTRTFANVGANGSQVRFSWPVGSGNVANGIQGFLISAGTGDAFNGSQVFFQIRFDTPLPKTVEDILQVDFQLFWGRA